MTKFEISTLPGRSNVYGLWVALEDKNSVMVLEGSKEYLSTEDAQKFAETKAEIHWKCWAAELKMLDEISAKYPKKSIFLDGGEIMVHNKNGNFFKSFKVEY